MVISFGSEAKEMHLDFGSLRTENLAVGELFIIFVFYLHCTWREEQHPYFSCLGVGWLSFIMYMVFSLRFSTMLKWKQIGQTTTIIAGALNFPLFRSPINFMFPTVHICIRKLMIYWSQYSYDCNLEYLKRKQKIFLSLRLNDVIDL